MYGLGGVSLSPDNLKKLAALAILAVAAVFVLDGLLDSDEPDDGVTVHSGGQDIEMLRVEVVERYPHARDAFTQGLLWHGGKLYEGTGLRGQSTLRLIDLATGQTERRIDLDPSLFGEGLALVGDRLIQLTWTSGKAIVYRRDDFAKVGEFKYQGQGWGLCYDGEHLYMSNGSATLTVRDPDTFQIVERRQVTIRGRPQARLNELECVDGQIYANVWEYDQIIRIDAATGQVNAIISGTGLLTRSVRQTVDVLNGIAYMPERKHFLLTGKYWPQLFEVRFVPR